MFPRTFVKRGVFLSNLVFFGWGACTSRPRSSISPRRDARIPFPHTTHLIRHFVETKWPIFRRHAFRFDETRISMECVGCMIACAFRFGEMLENMSASVKQAIFEINSQKFVNEFSNFQNHPKHGRSNGKTIEGGILTVSVGNIQNSI